MPGIRLAVDIGGTFTDLAIIGPGGLHTAKVLTTPRAPERGVLDGVDVLLRGTDLKPGDIGTVVHGTTLATNALIERRGAKTALVVTEGLRDSVEMAQENRFAQYDISSNRPLPLVPRHLRLPVRERLNWRGDVLTPLDEASVLNLVPELKRREVESVAVGLIHAYANPQHEQRVAELLAEALPDVYFSLSSEVCPEIREYERQSTTCANAYVRPLMARYLTALAAGLKRLEIGCPVLMMSSGGTLMGLDAASRFPIRLVESGPAGGAILAAQIAGDEELDAVLSFDMGGTTAKICLIDDATPLTSRSFEVARAYRFMRGSGLPVRIPVIEMVEIGAGGGSLASTDALGRIHVGPQSAGSEPGPACYGLGGVHPGVTDADLLLGKLNPDRFAGGQFTLDSHAATRAIESDVAAPLGLDVESAAFGIAEVVEENMASAARMHAVEWGTDVRGRVMIAFGGAAPLHAAALARKLNIERVLIPRGAGVGSAIGFLRAPVAYEVVRSRYVRVDQLGQHLIDAVFQEMRVEATALLEEAAGTGHLTEQRLAYMRYLGQGHEIPVEVPLTATPEILMAAFESAYTRLFGRTIANLDVEILSWTLRLSAPENEISWPTADGSSAGDGEARERALFEPEPGGVVPASVLGRAALSSHTVVHGPALVEEDQTTTVVPSGFTATLTRHGHILLVNENMSTGRSARDGQEVTA
ncbi:MAG: hydantoinase/oxoprolinase family protein [Pseudomonadota bacterium]